MHESNFEKQKEVERNPFKLDCEPLPQLNISRNDAIYFRPRLQLWQYDRAKSQVLNKLAQIKTTVIAPTQVNFNIFLHSIRKYPYE